MPRANYAQVLTSSCINKSVDVQLVISAALALSPVHDCDVDHFGGVDAVDVQLVINAGLGIS